MGLGLPRFELELAGGTYSQIIAPNSVHRGFPLIYSFEYLEPAALPGYATTPL